MESKARITFMESTGKLDTVFWQDPSYPILGRGFYITSDVQDFDNPHVLASLL